MFSSPLAYGVMVWKSVRLPSFADVMPDVVAVI